MLAYVGHGSLSRAAGSPDLWLAGLSTTSAHSYNYDYDDNNPEEYQKPNPYFLKHRYSSEDYFIDLCKSACYLPLLALEVSPPSQ